MLAKIEGGNKKELVLENAGEHRSSSNFKGVSIAQRSAMQAYLYLGSGVRFTKVKMLLS